MYRTLLARCEYEVCSHWKNRRRGYVTPLLLLGFNENEHRTHTLQARCGTFTLLPAPRFFHDTPFRPPTTLRIVRVHLSAKLYRCREKGSADCREYTHVFCDVVERSELDNQRILYARDDLLRRTITCGCDRRKYAWYYSWWKKGYILLGVVRGRGRGWALSRTQISHNAAHRNGEFPLPQCCE